MRIFCFWYMSVWICGNLNVENKMQARKLGCSLKFTHCKLGIWKLLEWMWAQDVCRWLTHCSCESRAQLLVHPLWLRNFGKLLNECEPKDACRRFSHFRLGILENFLNECEPEDACRRFTHCRLGIWKLLNECEPRMHVTGLPTVEREPGDTCCQFTHCRS